MFTKNICTFNNCGRLFPELNKLIVHIETNHIDHNAKTTAIMEEEKPSAIHFSYILPFTSLYLRLDENSTDNSNLKLKSCGFVKTEPTFCNLETNPIENVNDASQSVPETNKTKRRKTSLKKEVKRFPCTVPGCSKSYKYSSGFRYHIKHGHTDKIRTRKRGRKKNKVSSKAETEPEDKDLFMMFSRSDFYLQDPFCLQDPFSLQALAGKEIPSIDIYDREFVL